MCITRASSRDTRRCAAEQRDELAPLHGLSSPKLGRRHPNASNECVDRAQTGIKTIAAVHSQCQVGVISLEGDRGRGLVYVRSTSNRVGILCTAVKDAW